MIDSTQQSKAAIFQCDCGSEGLVVVVESDLERECEGAPFIDIAFFGMGSYADGRLSWYNRLRWVWKILRTGNPFTDMVCLRSNVAKNMAYHILYLLSRNKPVKVDPNYLVKIPNDGFPENWGKVNVNSKSVNF